ncbi:hypothetical protein Tco_0662320 [Tanacetum coccineum]
MLSPAEYAWRAMNITNSGFSVMCPFPMDLFSFIHHVDPTKVGVAEMEKAGYQVPLLKATGGRNGAEKEHSTGGGEYVVLSEAIVEPVTEDVAEKPRRLKKKRKATGDASSSTLPPKKLRDDYGTSGASASTGGKSHAVMQDLLDNNKLVAEIGITTAATDLTCGSEVYYSGSLRQAEAIRLRGHVATTTCAKLRNQVAGYELFKEQIEAVQDDQVRVLTEKIAEVDANLMGMALQLDDEFYPSYLTTVVGPRSILSRGLKLVASILGKAIGRAVDKGIQDGLKDVSIADIMDYLHLEGLVAETSDAGNLQPSHEQLMITIHKPEDNVVLGETSLSFSLEVIHNRIQRIRGDAEA